MDLMVFCMYSKCCAKDVWRDIGAFIWPGLLFRAPLFFNLASLFFNLTSFFNLGKLFFLTLPRYLSFLTLPPLFSDLATSFF